MAWLDQILAAAQQARAGLAGDPGQSAATGTTSSTTGGTEYPGVQSAAAAASPEAKARAAFQDFAAGFGLHARQQRAQGRSGAEQLLSSHPLLRNPNAPAGDPLAAVLQVNNSAGSGREGQAFQEFGAGDKRYHVYYDPKTGKRKVVSFVLPKPAG